jgi:subtilisin family serine protease
MTKYKIIQMEKGWKFLIMKIFLILIYLLPYLLFSQTLKEWQHLDPEKDKVLGISTIRAYDFLKNKKSKPVIVAVIDNGADIGHEDLKGRFWVNHGEIPGNGIDDDKNGYIDDIHGWNFLGNKKGENIKRDQTELTRIYANLINKYNDSASIQNLQKDSSQYLYHKKIKSAYLTTVSDKKKEISIYENLLKRFLNADSVIKLKFPSGEYSQLDLFRLNDSSAHVLSARNFLLDMYASEIDKQKLLSYIKNCNDDLTTRLNPQFNIRQQIIGDNPDDLQDNVYGNNIVDAQSPYHGTGVSGTIAALYNELGVTGVAKNVKIMVLRILPNGDESDKDVALAIKYAVKNKADIINCSFGKSYSMHPEFVIQAIKEAENAGVLIVHAAGNDGRNNDSIITYPTGFYADGKRAANWICVGASTSEDNKGIVAYFSNYGKKSVDVFAPGYDIPSCALGNKYDVSSGTSTAAPIVSGVAAVLKSYFPKLKANEIKEIILKSAYKPKNQIVKLPGNNNKIANFKNISVSGGIVNLYNAVILAKTEY